MLLNSGPLAISGNSAARPLARARARSASRLMNPRSAMIGARDRLIVDERECEECIRALPTT